MKFIRLKPSIFVLLFIFCIGVFLRFYQLDSIPNGLYQDETSIGYNAYSILSTGKDEYGKNFPLYFKSFGDQKLPVYIYSTVASEYLFGVNEFAVRFPSAFFGSLTIIAIFLLVKLLLGRTNIALVSSFLFSINPWSIHYNRATFEVSICLFLFTIGTYFIVKSFKLKTTWLFFLGTSSFILCLYSYNLTRLLSPILYFILIFIYRTEVKKVRKSEIFMTFVLSFIFLLPFAVSFFDIGGANSAKGTLIFSSNAVKAPLLEFRSYFIYNPFFSKLFLNNYFLLGFQYINNIVAYLSTPFFFIDGSSHGNHGIGNVGQFYIFEFLLIITGLVVSVKNRTRENLLLVFWAIATIMVASLTRDIPQATRSFSLLLPMEVFSAIGLVIIIRKIRNLKNIYIKSAAAFFLCIIMIYSIVFYLSSYYVRFPIYYAKSWKSEDKKLVQYLLDNEHKYKNIIFDNKAGFVYSSFLFYSKYNPVGFFSSARRLPDDNEGFSRVESFGKYYFKDVDFTKDFETGNLIVTNKDNMPSEIAPIQVFDYPLRPVVVSLQEKIYEYPVIDNAYVLLEKK